MILFFKRFRLKKEMANEMESVWLRDYYLDRYGISIGQYSYGCFDSARFPGGTSIGRYCSFSRTCIVLNGNHGLDFLSLHPYLYNVSLGIVSQEAIRRTNLIVEDDVWVGHNAIILPSVRRIGRGSVIAAGAVVSKDVLPYEVVGGVPAQRIKMRFSEAVIDRIEKTNWWKWSKDELAQNIKDNKEMLYRPAEFFSNF
jgi:virginiamycin A acetyltransferase